jgi:hypothetical protein
MSPACHRACNGPGGGRNWDFPVTFMFPCRKAVKKTRHKIPPCITCWFIGSFIPFLNSYPNLLMLPSGCALKALRRAQKAMKMGKTLPHTLHCSMHSWGLVCPQEVQFCQQVPPYSPGVGNAYTLHHLPQEAKPRAVGVPPV